MSVRHMSGVALFAALLCVCAWVGFPLGDTVITLQTLALYLALLLLGAKGGFWVVVVYLLLGAVGLPVFSGFRGGIGTLLGPTGGYLWGFLLCCGVYSLFPKRPLAGLLVGTFCCYLCGSLWYCCVYLPGGFWAVVVKCVLPYLLPDGVKLWLAWVLHRRLSKFITLPCRA